MTWIRRSLALAALVSGGNALSILWGMQAQQTSFEQLETSLELDLRARELVERVQGGDMKVQSETAEIGRELESFDLAALDSLNPLQESWSRLAIALESDASDPLAAQILDEHLAKFTQAIAAQRETMRRDFARDRNRNGGLAFGLALLGMSASLLAYIRLDRWLGSLSRVAIANRTHINAVGASIASQDRAASARASALIEISEMLERLNTISQESSEQSSIAAAHAKEIAQLTSTGAQQMTHASSTIAETEDQALDISQQVLQLRERATEVGQVAFLVEELSTRTNTLSLNAAIEAVRAGRSGAGFQAIAQEIRALSVQSQKAAQRIGALSEDIHRSTDETVSASQEGIACVEASTRIVSEITTTFAEIQAAVKEIDDTSHKLAFNAYVQLWPIQQLVEGIESLNTGAREAETSSRELADSLGDLQLGFGDIQARLSQRGRWWIELGYGFSVRYGNLAPSQVVNQQTNRMRQHLG